MKRFLSFVFLSALAIAPATSIAANGGQVYSSPSPGRDNGYWVPYSHMFPARDYESEKDYSATWVDAPIKVESVVSNCDRAVMVLHWGDDASIKSAHEGSNVVSGDMPIGLGYKNYDLGLFAQHGFSFVGGAPSAGNRSCDFFVSGERWVPGASEAH